MSRLFFALLLFVLPCCADVNCPDGNTIADLAHKSKKTLDNFFAETLHQRLAIESHNGELSDKYKIEVADAAQKYAQTLAQIFTRQLELKKQIEDYNSSDREQRFGTTGLWNNLKDDIADSQARLNRIDGFRILNKDTYADAAECVKDDNAVSLHENFTTKCKILLNKETAGDANKVSTILKNEDTPMLKAKAYWTLKDKPRAISELAKVENPDSLDANFCKFIINDIIKDADQMAETCGRSFIENCAVVSAKIGDDISAVEFAVVGSDGNDLKKIADRAEKINSVDYASLRALARFNAKTGNFGRAYELWSKMLTISDENIMLVKYYQLFCLSKMSAADRQTAIHTAKLLLHSRDVQQEFWQKKLQNLIYGKP
jgi:hypothetical protein